jgi:hypothetical protein
MSDETTSGTPGRREGCGHSPVDSRYPGVASQTLSWYIDDSMIRFVLTSILRPAGLAFALFFTLTLLWCGDSQCLSGDSECALPVCSLLTDHASFGDNPAANGDGCDCFCHAPTIPQVQLCVRYFPPVMKTRDSVFLATLPEPTRAIDHPPLTT